MTTTSQDTIDIAALEAIAAVPNPQYSPSDEVMFSRTKLRILIAAYKREQARNQREGTHWEGCHLEGGPRHYECLFRKFEELTAERDALKAENERAEAYISRIEGFCRVVRNIVDPNELAADGGITVWDVLQEEAAEFAALEFRSALTIKRTI